MLNSFKGLKISDPESQSQDNNSQSAEADHGTGQGVGVSFKPSDMYKIHAESREQDDRYHCQNGNQCKESGDKNDAP